MGYIPTPVTFIDRALSFLRREVRVFGVCMLCVVRCALCVVRLALCVVRCGVWRCVGCGCDIPQVQ
jgi:hypothetical protein